MADLKTIELAHSKYKFVYEPGNEGLFRVFRFDEDVTDQVKNNPMIDLFLAFINQPMLNDTEQRLFLAAMSKEERVCKNDKYVEDLVPVCKSIEYKVTHSGLWCRNT